MVWGDDAKFESDPNLKAGTPVWTVTTVLNRNRFRNTFEVRKQSIQFVRKTKTITQINDEKPQTRTTIDYIISTSSSYEDDEPGEPSEFRAYVGSNCWLTEEEALEEAAEKFAALMKELDGLCRQNPRYERYR